MSHYNHNPVPPPQVREPVSPSPSRITPEWLGLRRLAEYSDTSERTLRGWIHSPVDPLPAVRIGGKILVRRADFDTWMQRHKIEPLATDDVDAIVREVVEGVTVER